MANIGYRTFKQLAAHMASKFAFASRASFWVAKVRLVSVYGAKP